MGTWEELKIRECVAIPTTETAVPPAQSLTESGGRGQYLEKADSSQTGLVQNRAQLLTSCQILEPQGLPCSVGLTQAALTLKGGVRT